MYDATKFVCATLYGKKQVPNKQKYILVSDRKKIKWINGHADKFTLEKLIIISLKY
jgi:hypothetical protein